MNYLNQIHLRGVVGRTSTTKVGDSEITRFTGQAFIGYREVNPVI